MGMTIDDCVKDGGKEFVTKMFRVLSNRQGFVIRTQCVLLKNSSPPSSAQLSISNSILVHNLLAIDISILFLK